VALGSGGRLLAPAYAGPDALVHAADGRQVGVADCLVLQQGPNYALAKSLQRWRATVARAEGVLTSVHVAPPTRTASVLRNRLLAAAYRGAARFGIETFDPGTTRALMAALLVHDLHNPRAAARPDVTLRHPLDLFVGAANPGGLWRCGYRSRTVLAPAVLSGALHRRPTRESERS
jgi:hypothetical protein